MDDPHPGSPLIQPRCILTQSQRDSQPWEDSVLGVDGALQADARIAFSTSLITEACLTPLGSVSVRKTRGHHGFRALGGVEAAELCAGGPR